MTGDRATTNDRNQGADRMTDIEKVLGQLEALARKWQGEGKPAAAAGRSTVAREARLSQ